jgi:RNA polymerase sigma-70 factor (sigma-E family)
MDQDVEFTEYAQARQHYLLRTAYLLCGDSNSAQDLAQEALTNLCKAWPRVRRADSVEAYARRTLINAYFSHQRKLRRDREARVALARQPQTYGSPDQTELRLELLAALDQLGERSRAVLVLRFWDDLTIHDTATALGCTVGTVKSQTSRALARLREVLGEDRFDTGSTAHTATKGH